LTYNCIRNFLNQTTHQLVFQRLPIIDTIEDFMVLFDFDTRSRWKRAPFSPDLLSEVQLHVAPLPINFWRLDVPTDDRTKEAYQREKQKLIDGIGLKDPHTIPRNLHLFAGKAKLKHVDTGLAYVGRNNRFRLSNLKTYDEAYGGEGWTIFEFCHRFIDFSDFLAQTDSREINALVSDLKVDEWYFERFRAWGRRLDDAYAALHG